MRLSYLVALFGMAALLSPVPVVAQVYSIFAPGIVETPEIHLGSATEPSVVNIPPVVVQQPGLPLPMFGPSAADFGPFDSQQAECRPGGFDYLVSPSSELFPGSMADASISLGEYARELRAHRPEGPPPIHLDLNSSPR